MFYLYVATGDRGMAVVDSSMPYGLKLMIEDYPYVVDGLEIWFAIISWVKEYLSFYYQNDDAVKSDTELQAWWSEIRNVGHGDKKDETWWYNMETMEEVEKALTTIIWVASALHAAVNFGQYPYASSHLACRLYFCFCLYAHVIQLEAFCTNLATKSFQICIPGLLMCCRFVGRNLLDILK
jgi:hypothetical protein